MEKEHQTIQSHQNILKKPRLYQVNQEVISYRTYEVGTHTEIVHKFVNLNNRTTAVERECLNRTL